MTDWDENDETDLVTAEGYMLRAGEDPEAARIAFEKRINPQVLSTANPQADWLRDARALLNRDGALRDFVREARAGGTDAEAAIDGLSIRLNERWESRHAAEAYEVAKYLWDEQSQLGDGIYLISKETGKVITTLNEDDIYQPSPVPREGGGLATPLPRIRPELEAALTCWFHDKAREARIVETLATRVHQTALLQEEGDTRLLVATRAGRRHIVESLARFDPKVLLRAAGGTSGSFLQHFELLEADPLNTIGLYLIEGEAHSQSVMGVQDLLTTNLHHNRAASLQGALVQGWVREVARQLSRAACDPAKCPYPIGEVHTGELTKAHLGDADFWVVPPEALRYLRKVSPHVGLMPVVCAHVLGLRSKVGVLVVPPEFAATSQEMFDRWETHSSLKFRLWIDWTKVQALDLVGIEHQANLA